MILRETLENALDLTYRTNKSRVLFESSMSSDQNNLVNSTWTTVEFDTEVGGASLGDPGGYYGTGNYGILTPVAGWYYFRGYVELKSIGNNIRFGARIYNSTDAASLITTNYITGDGTYNGVCASGLTYVPASKRVVVQAFHINGDNVPDIHDDRCHYSGFLQSPNT